MIPSLSQLLIFADVVFVVLGATAGLGLYLDHGYQKGRFDAHMDAATGYDASAARTEAYGEPQRRFYNNGTEEL